MKTTFSLDLEPQVVSEGLVNPESGSVMKRSKLARDCLNTVQCLIGDVVASKPTHSHIHKNV